MTWGKSREFAKFANEVRLVEVSAFQSERCVPVVRCQVPKRTMKTKDATK